MDMAHIEASFREGVNQLQQANYAKALEYLDAVLTLLPAQLDAAYYKSITLLRLERYRAAIACLQPSLDQATAQTPIRLLADCHKALGSALQGLSEFSAALTSFERACQLDPNSVDRRIDRVQCMLKAGQHEQIEAALQTAEASEPDNIRVISARAELAFQTWDVPTYLKHIQRAIRLQPTQMDLLCQYLMALNYLEDPDSSASAAAEHVAIGSALAGLLPSHDATPLKTRDDTHERKKLRLGFISPDLKRHSVSYFLLALLKGLGKLPVETYCYGTAIHRDAVTEQIESTASTFRQLQSSRDFDQIENDGLDILIDLAGHTHSNQFEALVHNRKLAPFYAHWMGYPNTTGFRCFDFRIVDAITDPPGQEEPCAEQRLFLEPCFLCYAPPADTPPVAPLPSKQSQWITLASHNNLNKVTSKMLHIWATLLQREPRFRLRIKSPLVTIPGVEARLRAHFDSMHIAPERIEWIPRFSDLQDYLASYRQIDFTLDSFPYNGTTTTFESLLMGCPVLTLAGHCHRSRVSASILTQVGLQDWVTESNETYIERALNAARELDGLAQLRRKLRERLLESTLCDTNAFAHNFITTLRNAGVGGKQR